jgi:hypothetical protein
MNHRKARVFAQRDAVFLQSNHRIANLLAGYPENSDGKGG